MPTHGPRLQRLLNAYLTQEGIDPATVGCVSPASGKAAARKSLKVKDTELARMLQDAGLTLTQKNPEEIS